jgi:hypothetical protein
MNPIIRTIFLYKIFTLYNIDNRFIEPSMQNNENKTKEELIKIIEQLEKLLKSF